MLFLTCCVCEPCPVLGLGGVLSPGLSPRGQVNKAQLNKENEDEALKQATQREQASPRTNTTNQHNRGTITSGKRVLAVPPRDRPPTRNEREKEKRNRERERERERDGKEARMTVATKMNTTTTTTTTTRGRFRVRRVRRVVRSVTTRMMVTGGNTGSNTPAAGGPGSTPSAASTRTRRDNSPREQTGALAHHQGMAPSCPLVLNGKDLVADDGRNGNALPIEVRRLAGEFIDSEECSAVPQGKKHKQRPFFFLLCLPTQSLTHSLTYTHFLSSRVCLANKHTGWWRFWKYQGL